MKKVLIYSAVGALLFAMAVSGCDKPNEERVCDPEIDNYCQLPDGSWGIYECVNGEFGECIPLEPSNAPPCAIMVEAELSDNMTIVTTCKDGEYVECMKEPFYYKGTLYEGIYCEKIFESGVVVAQFFPWVEPDEYGCWLLNLVCCLSDAENCADEEETEE